MNTKMIAGALALAAVAATPAMANSTQRFMGPAQHSADSTGVAPMQHDRRAQRTRGFAPVDAAAGLVGGAVGAAGAIATAPFTNSYASYDRPYYGEAYVGGARQGRDDLQRSGSGQSASFGRDWTGTRSPASDGDMGN